MNNEQKLLAIFAEVLDVEEDSLAMNTTPSDVAEWDSLATVQLIAEIEDVFDCKIPFEEVERIQAIRDFLKFI